jgi:ribosomal protein L7/L12
MEKFNVQDFLKALKEMSVLELNELVKAIGCFAMSLPEHSQ